MSNFNKTKLAISVLMNVLLISLFIGIFFFTYVNTIEYKIVKSNIQFLTFDINNILRLFGENVNIKIKDEINNMEIPDLTNEDSATELSNTKIMIKAALVNLVLTIIICGIIFLIYYNSKKNFNVKILIYQNIILLLFVALTEFSFMTFFAIDFMSINTNNIKYNIVQNLKSL